jgi:hypothetical protein
MKTCLHWREEFKIGPYIFLVSSEYALTSKLCKAQSKLEPQFGVYLSEIWEGIPLSYPAIIIRWPDYGAIELKALNKIISTIKEKLTQGLIIDVACILGHGRTGTLLACLLVEFEGISAEAAILEVRTRHCEYAIECLDQEELIAEFATSKLGS